jgi:hypothetical protein
MPEAPSDSREFAQTTDFYRLSLSGGGPACKAVGETREFREYQQPPGDFSADRDGARNLYKVLRTAFPDFHAEIHWQISDRDRVTTFKTYHGTHLGEFWGIAPTAPILHRISS